MTEGFRLLALDDVERAAFVMSQALVEDPLCVYMLPNDRTRVQTLRRFFLAYGALGIGNRRGYGSGTPLEAVAFWNPPGQKRMSITVRQLGRFLPLLFTQYVSGIYRVSSVDRRIDAMHEKHAPEPHYYLDNIAVLKEHRGRGLASSLIQPVLGLAAQQGLSVYTDTVTEANVPLYEHLGFRCVEIQPVAEAGITIWALLRPTTDMGSDH